VPSSPGTDEFFEGLCTLALQVDAPEIDDVLAGLFYRWTQRFDIGSPVLQHDQNHELWRGFGRLAEHPRFGNRWMAVTPSISAACANRHVLVRVQERDPVPTFRLSLCCSRPQIGSIHQDEIDRLDEAADRNCWKKTRMRNDAMIVRRLMSLAERGQIQFFSAHALGAWLGGRDW
jgi:hypothetical protein